MDLVIFYFVWEFTIYVYLTNDILYRIFIIFISRLYLWRILFIYLCSISSKDIIAPSIIFDSCSLLLIGYYRIINYALITSRTTLIYDNKWVNYSRKSFWYDFSYDFLIYTEYRYRSPVLLLSVVSFAFITLRIDFIFHCIC